MANYKNRLTPNTITGGLEELESLKEYLFSIRYDEAKSMKSEPWTEEELTNVFKDLSPGKARDAHGHLYELFKFGGQDLKISILQMANKIK